MSATSTKHTLHTSPCHNQSTNHNSRTQWPHLQSVITITGSHEKRMGSVSLNIGDGTARFRRPTCCSSALNLIMLVSILITNLFALYAFTYSSPQPSSTQQKNNNVTAILSEHVSDILRQIESSRSKLTQIERTILGYDTIDITKPQTPVELKLFLTRHPLPLGRDSRTGNTEMVSSVAHTCSQSHDLLFQYMSYKPGVICPDDADVAQKLLSRGCEPLPRRRCLSREARKPGIVRFPMSLWKPVSEKIVGGWNGFDRLMWAKPRGKNDFLIDDVLQLGGGKGWSRIGLDIEGGSGNFAARMAEKGVTIVTSTLDSNGHKVNEFVAARGLFPLEITPRMRFPFYDSVFDLVHTVNGLDESSSNGNGQLRPERLEFVMFDIDRILRPGGLFWLDNYHCMDDKSRSTITVLIEKFGYNKLKWVVGEKADTSGNGKSKVFLSAVLMNSTESPALSRFEPTKTLQPVVRRCLLGCHEKRKLLNCYLLTVYMAKSSCVIVQIFDDELLIKPTKALL